MWRRKQWVVAICLIGTLASCSFEGGGARRRGQSSPLLGKTAPDVQLPMLDGSQFRLADHAGKNIVMLDFWATWCGPCVEELPLLVQVAAEYESRGVVFCPINEQDSAQQIKRFLDAKKLDTPVAMDSGAVGGKYGVEGIPFLVLIDKSGVVQSVHVGYDPNIQDVLREELNALLAGESLVPVASTPSQEKPQPGGKAAK